MRMHSQAINRRRFLEHLGATTALTGLSLSCRHTHNDAPSRDVQPIRGSWTSIWWDDRRHFYWNETCRNFSSEQWKQSVKDAADLGMQYLVLLAIAKGGKAFYETPLLPKLEMACPDPIKALLEGGNEYGVKFFISSDWYAEWDHRALHDQERVTRRFQMMEEIAARYGDYRSFYGWYWPNEACITPYFTSEFIAYVNASSLHGRRLLPKAKTLTAPYGTRLAVNDDKFVRQLDQLDVDIIAYQDEVGCLRMGPHESQVAFARLRAAHDRVPQRALWADVETFAWEGPENRQTSPLIPAPFPRVLDQLKAVSWYVDTILIYQFQGLMNRLGSKAFAGHPESTRLYDDYLAWLRAHHPKVIRNTSLRR